MKTTPFVLDWPGAGRLAMMPRPAGFDWLADDMASLRGKGVDTLVCALTRPEQERLGLLREQEEAERAAITYVAFPVADFGVPAEEELLELSRRLAREVSEGRFVVAHCFGGIGRSGTIAGATLIQLGATADQAMEIMTTARGFSAPETDAQRDLLRRLGGRA